MVDTLRLDADWVRVVTSPDTGNQIDLGVPAGAETGTWTLNIYGDTRRESPAEVSVPGSNVGTVQAPVIRFQVSGAQNDALLAAGKVRRSCYWEIWHTETTAAWMRGDWIVNGGYEP